MSENYVEMLSKMPVLPTAEQNKLAVQAKNGNDEAGRRLIESNLRLIMKIAHEYRERHTPLWDVFSCGVEAMLRAIDGYERSKGNFSTYAGRAVKNALVRQIDTSRLVRPGLSTRWRLRAVASGRLARTAHTDDIDAATARTKTIPVSIHIPVLDACSQTGSGSIVLGDMLESKCPSPFEEASMNDLLPQLQDALEILDERERTVITMRFGIGDQPRATLAEVGCLVDLSKERVRQIEVEALKKLRAELT